MGPEISFVRSSAINLQHQQKSANHSFPDASCYEADIPKENKMQAEQRSKEWQSLVLQQIPSQKETQSKRQDNSKQEHLTAPEPPKPMRSLKDWQKDWRNTQMA